MNINNLNLTVAVEPDGYPTDILPEVAFVGRSNVGKSSLINSLLNRKIAKTSSSPGKTRTINFYNIDSQIHLVDLPGYGYAKAPKFEVAKWGKMIEKYLLNRSQLKAIILLLDIRHPPTENDHLMYNWLLHYNYEIVTIATKSDKVKRSQIKKHTKQIEAALNLKREMIPFSSLDKTNPDQLWEIIKDLGFETHLIK